MKKIGLILLSALMLAGCAKDFGEDIAVIDNHWEEVAQGDEDEPIVFPSEVFPETWVHVGDLETRFRACNVPTGILGTKTTRALGQSILHYPMNYLILTYNYYDVPVKMVHERSNLHRELAARPDAAEELIRIFDETGIDISINKSTGYSDITLQDELFLELFLGTGLVPGLDSGTNKGRLKTIVERKRNERLDNKDVFTDLALIPLAYMNERLGLGLKFDNDIVNTMHSFTMGDKLFGK